MLSQCITEEAKNGSYQRRRVLILIPRIRHSDPELRTSQPGPSSTLNRTYAKTGKTSVYPGPPRAQADFFSSQKMLPNKTWDCIRSCLSFVNRRGVVCEDADSSCSFRGTFLDVEDLRNRSLAGMPLGKPVCVPSLKTLPCPSAWLDILPALGPPHPILL